MPEQDHLEKAIIAAGLLADWLKSENLTIHALVKSVEDEHTKQALQNIRTAVDAIHDALFSERPARSENGEPATLAEWTEARAKRLTEEPPK